MPGLCVRRSACRSAPPAGPWEPSRQLLPKSSSLYGLRASRYERASSVKYRPPGPSKRLAGAAPGRCYRDGVCP